jgi:hypothetical protein
MLVLVYRRGALPVRQHAARGWRWALARVASRTRMRQGPEPEGQVMIRDLIATYALSFILIFGIVALWRSGRDDA